MKSRLLGALAGAALCSIASQASADIIVVYTGTVKTGGFDELGVFNSGTAILTDAYAGMSYRAEFKFDTTLGGNASTIFSSEFTGPVGGAAYSLPTYPAVFATVTINNVTVPVVGSYASGFFRYVTSSVSEIVHFASSDDAAGSRVSQALIYRNDNGLSGFPLNGPILNYSPISGDIAEARYLDHNYSSDRATDLSATIDMLSISSAVPEPSTWAMMLFGFAGAGFLAYRQRPKSQSKRRSVQAIISSS